MGILRLMKEKTWQPSEEDIRLMKLAMDVGARSDDTSERTPGVGAIIVSRGDVVVEAFNGIVNGVQRQAIRYTRPHKYNWTIHAEARAIALSARFNTNLWNKSMYVNKTPCTACMMSIIESGISHLYCFPPTSGVHEWDEQGKLALLMAEEARLSVFLMVP